MLAQAWSRGWPRIAGDIREEVDAAGAGARAGLTYCVIAAA